MPTGAEAAQAEARGLLLVARCERRIAAAASPRSRLYLMVLAELRRAVHKTGQECRCQVMLEAPQHQRRRRCQA
jgi:hypothetical protein